MDALFDKSYVMAQLHRARDFGMFKEAVSVIAGEHNPLVKTDWAQIRADLDKLLPSIPERQLRMPIEIQKLPKCFKATAGYPAYVGDFKTRRIDS